MPSFELQGTIQSIGELQTFNKGFTKREFILEVKDGKYPQSLKMECIKDKTALLDKISKGDQVNVNFDIRGSEYNGRHYVNLHAWKVAKGSADASAEEPTPAHLSSLEAAFDNEAEVSNDEPPF